VGGRLGAMQACKCRQRGTKQRKKKFLYTLFVLSHYGSGVDPVKKTESIKTWDPTPIHHDFVQLYSLYIYNINTTVLFSVKKIHHDEILPS
jgi:hypothetical protein